MEVEYLGPLKKKEYAPESNLPPFDIVLPPGEDPTEAAKKIVVGGLPETFVEYLGPLKTSKTEEPAQSILQNVAEMPRALGETAATILTGIPAWAVSRTYGIVAQALTGDKEFANQVEEDIARTIGFDPNDPKIAPYTTKLGKHLTQKIGEAINVVFGPIEEASKLPEESWKSPLLGKLLRFGGEAALPIAGKKIIPEIREIVKTVQDVVAKAKEKNIPLRQAESVKADLLAKEPVEYLAPLKEEARVEYVGPLKEVKLEESIPLKKPVAETLPETKVTAPIEPIVQPGASTVGKPTETGGTESRLAIRAEADSIAAKLTEDFGDLVEYKTMNMTDQANRAAEIIVSDYEGAKRMAMGEVKPPEGIREATMYEAVKIRAIKEGDIDTLQKLATESTIPTRLSEYGQAIKAADSRIMDDPVKVMQDVAKVRSEKIEKTTGGKVDPSTVVQASKNLDLAEEKLSNHEAMKAIKRLQNDVAKEQRQTQRVYAKEELSLEFDGLVKDLNKVLSGQLNIGVDPMAAVILGKMAKNRIQSGIITVEGVVDSIYTAVKNMGVELSKRDIMDAISGYGKYKLLNKDEILVTLRDLKGQMQQLSKLEDLQNKQPPLKTGVERRIPSDEERRLIREVNEAKKKYGVETVDKETQLKSALDKVKTGLKNQIADVTYQIESGERISRGKGVKLDPEAEVLKKQRDFLVSVRDALAEPTPKFAIEEPGKLPVRKEQVISQEQKITMAIKAAERMSGEYARRVGSGELSAKKKGQDILEAPELVEARSIRDTWKSLVEELKDAANPKKTPEQIAQQSLRTRLINEEKKLIQRIANLDFAEKGKKVAELDADTQKLKDARDTAKENYNALTQASGTVTKEEATRIVELSKTMTDLKQKYDPSTQKWATPQDKANYGAAKVAWGKYIAELKGENAPIITQVKGRFAEAKKAWEDNKARAVFDLAKDSAKIIADNSVAIVASFDLSFIGRQGWYTLATHPSAWWKGVKTSLNSFAAEIGGHNAMDAVLADIYSRPRYLNGEYQKARLMSLEEEVFPTSLPGRIPIGGRVFSASEAAFKSAGIEMRLGVYDILADMQKKNGVDTMKGGQAEALGTLINSLTYRGKWGEKGVSPGIKLVMWAPNIIKGQWDIMTAHTLGYGLDTAFAKKQAFTNLAKVVSEAVLVATIANAISPGSAETNPTSNTFGTIKVGDQHFDYTAGARSMIIGLAKIITGTSKDSKTGKITKLDEPGFGKNTRWNIVVNYLGNKFNPPAAMVRDWMKGEFFGGKPFTWLGALYRAYTPISIQQSIQLGEGKQPITIPKVGGVVSDIVGVNAPTFDKRQKKGGF